MLQVKQHRARLVAGWVTQALEQGRLGSCAHAGYHQYYISVVLRNDGEINVIDHARVVKTFRDPLSSLSDY